MELFRGKELYVECMPRGIEAILAAIASSSYRRLSIRAARGHQRQNQKTFSL